MSSITLTASSGAVISSIYKATHKDVNAGSITLAAGEMLLLGFSGLPSGALYGKIESIEVSMRGATSGSAREYAFIDSIVKAYDPATVNYEFFGRTGPKSNKCTAQYVYWTGTAWETKSYSGGTGETPPGLIQMLKNGLVVDKPTGEIYTHLNSTAANRPMLTITYDGTELATPTIASVTPAAGTFCPKTEDTTFSWTLGTSKPCVGEFTQASAVFYWRASSGSATQSVSIDGGTMSYTLPAGTFTTTSPQWRVVVTCTDGSTASSDWTTLDTAEVAPGKAEILAPKDIAINGSEATVLSWIHNISTGTQPMGCDIQKDVSGTVTDIAGGSVAAAMIAQYRAVNIFQKTAFESISWTSTDGVDYSGLPGASNTTKKLFVWPEGSAGAYTIRLAAHRHTAVSDQGLRIKVYYTDSSSDAATSVPSTSTAWAYRTITTDPEKTPDYVRIYVSSSSYNETWHIKDVQVERGTTASGYRASEQAGAADSTDADVIALMSDQDRAAAGRSAGATSFVAAAGTFPAGNPLWRVRTYNTDMTAGTWSDWASITSITQPATPGLRVTKASPRAEISWTASGQQAYQYQFDDYDSGPVFGTKATAKSPVFLAMGQAHTARVRVQNKYGLWSDWAEATFTPTRPGGSAVPSVGVAYPTPDENVEMRFFPTPGLSEFWIYRDGVLVKRTTEWFYMDYYLSGTTSYRIVATNPETDDYAEQTVNLTATFEGTVIGAADSGDWIHCKLTPEQAGTRTTRLARQVSQTYYAGHAYPRAELSEHWSKTLSFQVGFVNENDVAHLEGLVGTKVILKDKDTLVTGILADLTLRRNVFFPTYTISLAQLDRSDEEVVVDD